MEDGDIGDYMQDVSSEMYARYSPLTMTIANEGEHMQVPFAQLIEKLSEDRKGNFNFRRSPNQTHSSGRHASLMYAFQTGFFDWNPSRETKIVDWMV